MVSFREWVQDGTCWFDSGHSDSGDPASFKRAASLEALDFGGSDDNTAAPPEAWEYCRVPGLGLLPGLLCPHHDRTQSNGLLRAEDFASMVANNPAFPAGGGGGGGGGDGDGGSSCCWRGGSWCCGFRCQWS